MPSQRPLSLLLLLLLLLANDFRNEIADARARTRHGRRKLRRRRSRSRKKKPILGECFACCLLLWLIFSAILSMAKNEPNLWAWLAGTASSHSYSSTYSCSLCGSLSAHQASASCMGIRLLAPYAHFPASTRAFAFFRLSLVVMRHERYKQTTSWSYRRQYSCTLSVCK